MNNLSFKELQSRYAEALEIINDLSETLEKRESDIILLKYYIGSL